MYECSPPPCQNNALKGLLKEFPLVSYNASIQFFSFNILKDTIKGDKRNTLTAQEHLTVGMLTG